MTITTKYYINSITNQSFCSITQYEDDTQSQVRSQPILSKDDKEITKDEYEANIKKVSDNMLSEKRNEKDKNQKQLEESLIYAQSDYNILVKLSLSSALASKLTGFYSSDFTKKDIKSI